ncbi:hypothetical protein [Rhodoplanes sp. Z2-YC6860]|uniref:hypothetical protein n=1 Tax=Rhodoplanes sp. Z2-YC6860 TaxID=674703 RepID=UPI0012EDA91D|nr:hypothetical protein [Rhodoplanes sp. Z2-YC6860]
MDIKEIIAGADTQFSIGDANDSTPGKTPCEILTVASLRPFQRDSLPQPRRRCRQL